MNPDELEVFLAVVRERHFGRAAAVLGMSQPSVSRKLRALEEELGVELLVRTSRQVQLTPAGKALLEEVPQILARGQSARLRVQNAARGTTGHVRVGAVPGAMAAFVPQVIRTHQRGHPTVTVSLHELLAHTQIDELYGGELDVGFVRIAEMQQKELCSEALYEEPMCIAVADTHALAAEDWASIDALRDQPLILPPRHLSPHTYDRVVAECHSAGFDPHVVQEASTGSAMLGLVSAEVGIAVLAEDFHTLISEHVRLIRLSDFAVTLSMIWRADAPPVVAPMLDSARVVSADRRAAVR